MSFAEEFVDIDYYEYENVKKRQQSFTKDIASHFSESALVEEYKVFLTDNSNFEVHDTFELEEQSVNKDTIKLENFQQYQESNQFIQ